MTLLTLLLVLILGAALVGLLGYAVPPLDARIVALIRGLVIVVLLVVALVWLVHFLGLGGNLGLTRPR